MRIVAVTACPTGIAHTYMAAEQLENTGRKLGHQIKVETQGAMGIENRLTADDISNAELVIFAADIEIAERQRFAGLPAIEVPAQLAIRDPASIFAKIGG